MFVLYSCPQTEQLSIPTSITSECVLFLKKKSELKLQIFFFVKNVLAILNNTVTWQIALLAY